ncbi:MAG: fructose PTS transporter subunit IIB, partial [Cyanobacteria bacterium J06607_13]
MSNIVAITYSKAGEAHTQMAAEALKQTAQNLGHQLKVVALSNEQSAPPQAELDAADVVIAGADHFLDRDRFSGKPIYAVSTSEAIRNSELVIRNAIALVKGPASVNQLKTVPHPHDPYPDSSPPAQKSAVSTHSTTDTKFLVGITSCPTGIAHTFMAAEALKTGATKLGHDIKVETQGSVGAKNQLSEEEIARADAVVIAADTHVDLSRFSGKPVYETSTKAAIHDGSEVITAAL